MFNAPIKLAELFIQLVKVKNDRSTRRFDSITKELYELSKQTYQDFRDVFMETKSLIESNTETIEICNTLERKRLQGQPDRDHMRTLLEGIEPNQLTLFEYAVFDLLRIYLFSHYIWFCISMV